MRRLIVQTEEGLTFGLKSNQLKTELIQIEQLFFSYSSTFVKAAIFCIQLGFINLVIQLKLQSNDKIDGLKKLLSFCSTRNLFVGVTYWLSMCGTRLLGWRRWITFNLPWPHFHHKDSVSFCRRSNQPQCVRHLALSCDSVHREPLLTPATSSYGTNILGESMS